MTTPEPFVCGPVAPPASVLQRIGALVVAVAAVIFAIAAGAAPAAFTLHVLSGAFKSLGAPTP